MCCNSVIIKVRWNFSTITAVVTVAHEFNARYFIVFFCVRFMLKRRARY